MNKKTLFSFLAIALFTTFSFAQNRALPNKDVKTLDGSNFNITKIFLILHIKYLVIYNLTNMIKEMMSITGLFVNSIEYKINVFVCVYFYNHQKIL